MKRAALYSRVSSEIQAKERTIESQVSELKRHIDKAGDTLVKEYIDNGHSGALLDRPAMNALRDDLKTNTYDIIYFLAADRIARDVSYQNIIIGEILRHKKEIVISGENYQHNPENKFNLTVMGAVSELERAKIVERSQRGRKYKLKQGILMSNGSKLYGYTYHRKTMTSSAFYTVNRREAKIVKYIFETYASGDMSFVQIAEKLKREGSYRRPNTAPWNKDHVRTILHNETYTGIRYFDTMTDANTEEDPMHKSAKKRMVMRDRKYWIGIKIPAIIPKKLFDDAQDRLKLNQSSYRNAKGKQLLSGLIYCGKCGAHCFSFRQYFQIKRSFRIYEKYLYTCHGRRELGRCDTVQLDVRALDNLVFTMIAEVMIDPKQLKYAIPVLRQTKYQNIAKIETKLKTLEKKTKDANTKKERVLDLYASGNLEKDVYLKRIEAYDKTIEKLEGTQQELSTKTPLVHDPQVIDKALVRYCSTIKAELAETNSLKAKRHFLLNYISKVTYQNNKVTVCGSIPIDSGFVEFEVKQKIDRESLRAEILAHDRANGHRGMPIRREEFGQLKANAEVTNLNTL